MYNTYLKAAYLQLTTIKSIVIATYLATESLIAGIYLPNNGLSAKLVRIYKVSGRGA